MYAIRSYYAHRARQFGLAAAAFRNSSGVITLNMWADGLARRDLIGIAMFNGSTGCMVPFGGTRGVLGTNPLAYAIPTAGDPMVLDMATTEIPFFEIKNAKEKGSPLRENVAVDRHGKPTVIVITSYSIHYTKLYEATLLVATSTSITKMSSFNTI